MDEDAGGSKSGNASVATVRLSRAALRVIVVGSLALTMVSLLLWMEGDFERRFLLAHNPLRDDAAMVALSGALSRFGMSAICLLALGCAAASFRFPALLPVRPVLPVVLLSFGAATLAATLLKELVGRARPIADLAGALNVASAHGSPSFPSGHAAQSLALALPLALMVTGGSMVMRAVRFAPLVIAILVGYSRIAKGAHYLSDVLAGAALALVCVPVAVAAANVIYTRGKVTPEKMESMVKRQAFAMFALALWLPFV